MLLLVYRFVGNWLIQETFGNWTSAQSSVVHFVVRSEPLRGIILSRGVHFPQEEYEASQRFLIFS